MCNGPAARAWRTGGPSQRLSTADMHDCPPDHDRPSGLASSAASRSAEKVVAEQGFGRGGRGRGWRAGRPAGPRSRRRPASAPRPAPARAPGRSAAWTPRRPAHRRCPAAGTPRRSARPARVPAGLRDGPAGAGGRRSTRPARRSAGPRPRCRGPWAGSRSRWSAGARSAPSRSASTGSTRPSAWLSTSTPPAAARTPRSPSTVRRADPARPTECTSVVAEPTSTTSTGQPADPGQLAPWPGRTASGVGARTSRRNRGATAGPRPPSTCRSYSPTSTARAGPGTTSPRRGVTLSQASTVRPVARSSASASARGRGVAGQHHRVADPGPGQPAGVVQQTGRVVAVGPAEQQHHPGPGAAQQPHVGRLQRPGVHVHHLRPRRAGHPVPGVGAGQPLRADHGQPQPTAGRRAGQQLRLAGRRRRAGRGHRPHRRVHPGEHVRGGGRVLGETGQPAVRTDEHRFRPGGANVEADRGGLFGGHAHRP